ncbi:hypothetical protein AB84_2995 [Escherichia coli 2-052-05_S3_C1]|nr:hypothetical protein AB84_2995 [Escherichia coli 2-052-05_S3_C1]KDV84676.1 hypothetical protein AC42_2049 [Escherichia coli 2-052-05_S3_C3]KEN76130.1 hypothetical protein AC14_3009 [Escherichia coli 2-052-05_S3_C2]
MNLFVKRFCFFIYDSVFLIEPVHAFIKTFQPDICIIEHPGYNI